MSLLDAASVAAHASPVRDRLVSALGALVILGLAAALCPRGQHARIRPRVVLSGLALLVGGALLVLRTPLRALFGWASDAVDAMLGFSRAGAGFLFGPLADDDGSFGFLFAFQVLPTIVFFSALMAVAYQIGLMPLVVRTLGALLERVIGVGRVESLATAADIFVGQTESPLVVRPYLSALTRSELMACMTAGFATTAGGVMAGYVLMLRSHVPDIAGHLVACSVLSAPASLVIAKLMLPEAEPERVHDPDRLVLPRAASGLLDAITVGTTDGLRLAVNVGAMIIAFLALTALADHCLGWLTGRLFGAAVRIEDVLAALFYPLAYLLGVTAEDVPKVASLLGQKTVMNEFVAYASLARELAADPAWLSPRSRVIVSYALCGFANFASIGIQIGGYASLVPERRADLAALGPRAMVAGLLATCLVACVAGVLG